MAGSQLENGDSREKLEADAQSTANAIYLMAYDDGAAQSGRDAEPVRVGTQWITELLDRQAAISEIDAIDRWDTRTAVKAAELQAKLDKLEAERDRIQQRNVDLTRKLTDLRVRAAGLYEGEQTQEMVVKSLRDERDKLKAVVQQQADSFKGMEAKLKKANDTANTLRISVAGLKQTVDRQHGTIDALTADNTRLKNALAKPPEKQMPKRVQWPRHADGKLVKLNGHEAFAVTFSRHCYSVLWADESEESHGYGVAVDR